MDTRRPIARSSDDSECGLTAGVSRREVLAGGAAVLLAGVAPIGARADPRAGTSSPNHSGDSKMDTITTTDGVTIFYKDWGTGQPIVFSHGWPLSADDWDAQMMFFLNRGFRVIAHDRRGHGRSTQTAYGHDMDHYADDLAALTAHLNLKNADPCRAFHWRRRSCTIPRTSWGASRCQSGSHQFGAADHGQDG